MAKRVLDVGQCGPDHAPIRRMIEGRFGAQVSQVDTSDAALAALRAGQFDLVLVNRKLDHDYTDGVDVIRRIKADAALAAVPCMLVSNYPEYQIEAVAAGAEPGFGKQELNQPATHERLAKFLVVPADQPS
ncbi:MAG: response regulator [Planctomycetia bacterium]|nr:response regulator [Planctomycetia bacterium]